MRCWRFSITWIVTVMLSVVAGAQTTADKASPFDPVDVVKLRKEAAAAAQAAQKAEVEAKAAQLQPAADQLIQINDAELQQIHRDLNQIRLAPQLEKAAFLGVALATVDPALREQLNLPPHLGISVQTIVPDSPAETAGMKPHDIIAKLNDQLIFDVYQLSALVRSFKSGDEVRVSLFRKGEHMTLTVKLVEKEVPVLVENHPPLAPPPLLPPDGRQGVLNITADATDTGRPLTIVQARNDGVVRVNALALFAGLDGSLPRLPSQKLDAITWSDDDHTFALTAKKEGDVKLLYLVAKNLEGTIVFDGPINTPDELKGLPKEIAEKLDAPAVTAIIEVMRGNAPVKNPARERANRVKSASNLRQMGQGVMLYANDHKGAYPPDLGQLLVQEDLNVQVFTSPSSDTNVPAEIRNAKSQEKAAWVNANSDYVYVGAKVGNNAPAETILAYEKPEIHGGEGMNVLFNDGHVEWMTVAAALRLIQKQNAP